MKRVRVREVWLCNRHLADKLPISGRLIVHLDAEVNCDEPHPEIQQILDEAVRILSEAPTHA